MESYSERELWILVDRALCLLGFQTGRNSKVDRALEGFFEKRARLVHSGDGIRVQVPTMTEATNFLRYYFRRLKARDRDRVVNAYRPLAKRVRNRVRKRFWRSLVKY